ncbi:Adenine phosphoribosyltransferase [Coniochaeta hoffmannii]|uniref:adenine phosphoribosyltransferase n=1 Tax=Coniochaeta hoffmannii TaxID=91930 RepID=A0AA38RKH3_9PEZI|nr:Adenine phosphoribosyltransferase [Coniochaeta hoffmannii]
MTSTSNQSAPQVSTSSEQHKAQPAALTTSEAAILAGSNQDAAGRQPSSSAASASELASTKISLLAALRRFPDFPIPGINFIDILPIFQNPTTHRALLRALELQVLEFGVKPDVVVGLDARGFLFGPQLALQLGASFVPVRKQGKLPGPCVTATYEKEYGQDFFQMQEAAIKPGQQVLVVDDIIATGGSAQAAGSLVKQLGGDLIGYLFILEIPFLKGRDKLGGLPTVTLLETDD